MSLNPSPKDRLTDEEYKDIADKYMADMGYENQPYVVFKHMESGQALSRITIFYN